MKMALAAKRRSVLHDSNTITAANSRFVDDPLEQNKPSDWRWHISSQSACPGYLFALVGWKGCYRNNDNSSTRIQI